MHVHVCGVCVCVHVCGVCVCVCQNTDTRGIGRHDKTLPLVRVKFEETGNSRRHY